MGCSFIVFTRKVFRLVAAGLLTCPGRLTLLSVAGGVSNPAFLRFHPDRNLLYLCTESINDAGDIFAYAVSPITGKLTFLGKQTAAGKSTCYLTIDSEKKHMLYANYWDSTIGAMPLAPEGTLEPGTVHICSGVKQASSVRAEHLNNRQAEPHAHAIVLDQYFGRVAYVPDLGSDCIRQYLYDSDTGQLKAAGSVPAGREGVAHGPRYMVFHASLPVSYVVNELASTVSLFEVQQVVIETLKEGDERQTLSLVQTISTIPSGYPSELNTCGRIAINPCGTYVCVSNRGHNSIAVFRVNREEGSLENTGYFHTGGKTPRHFQFGPDGNFLFVANQDTDNVCVFRFDKEHGTLELTGYKYDVPSPNFACVVKTHPMKPQNPSC